MLRWRLLFSAVLIPSFIGLFWIDARLFPEAAWLLLILALLLAARACWELADLITTRVMKPSVVWPAGCSIVVITAGWVEHAFSASVKGSAGDWIALAFVLSLLLLIFVRALRYREPGAQIESLGAELLILSYIGLLFAVTLQLRWVAGAQAGYLPLSSLIVATKSGDTSAYFLGRFFGKRKMSPYLSPGKTWMGALGALLGSGLGTWVWLHFATPMFGEGWKPPAWYWSLGFGMALGVVGLIGDLCESLIKRDVQRKDSAPLMPGFGGLLDLLDSIIYAGPVAYLLWRILPLATWQS